MYCVLISTNYPYDSLEQGAYHSPSISATIPVSYTHLDFRQIVFFLLQNKSAPVGRNLCIDINVADKGFDKLFFTAEPVSYTHLFEVQSQVHFAASLNGKYINPYYPVSYTHLVQVR